ncbi:hypothetical protein ACFRYQ_002650 [Escherichia coli]
MAGILASLIVNSLNKRK